MTEIASNKFVLLRQQAEKLLQHQPDPAPKVPSDILDLIHELHVHQAELEIQNEELKRAQHEISELHREYENLYEFAPCAYLTLNSKGIITRINLTGVRLLENPKTLVMHSGFGRFLTPEWEDIYLAARRRSAETRETQSIELPLKTKNGSPLWVRADIEARKNETDETIQWRMVLVDITEQKAADAALRESEARFSAMFEYNTSGVAVYEPVDDGKDFLFKAFNPAAERITRITREEALGNRLLGLFPNMDKTGLLEVLRRVWRTGRAEQLPPFHYKDENREGWRENRVFKLPSDEVVALFDDITARKEAEEALRASENKLKTLIEAVPDMVWEFDENEIFTFCSRSYKEALGYEPSELVGKSAYTIMPPNEAEKVKKAFETIKREREPLIDFLNINLTKEGETRWLRSSAVPIIDDEGNYRGYRGIDRDITDIKKAQEEKEQLEDQLQQARKMEAIGTLAGGIAHEFNNVLGIILGNTELALDDVPHWNPASESLKEIKAACLRAKEVVRQILAFARKSMSARKPFEIATVVRECLKLMRASIPTTIDLEMNITCDSEMVSGNPTEIHQVLMNLCTNAAQAMGMKTGVLEVALSKVTLDTESAALYEGIGAGDYVRLSVKDNGCGMKSETLEKIFEPYFTTKEVGQGTGMGLAVVYGIVKKADGAIRATSEFGKGTTIEILFPLYEGVKEPWAHDEAVINQKGKGQRILFVDDEPSMVNLFKLTLERLGYAVTGMTDSLSALECFKNGPQKYDLVITDMSMPRMAGDQLTRELLKIRPDLPILICTGHSDHMDRNLAKQMGIQGYLSKPLDRKELALTVAKLLKDDPEVS